jgi:phenylalanyl-tRNA synthetase alpha chain
MLFPAPPAAAPGPRYNSPMPEYLPPLHCSLLGLLSEQGEAASVEQLCNASGIDQSQLMAAAVELEQQGLLQRSEQPYTELRLGELGLALQHGSAELPERLLARCVRQYGGAASLKDLAGDSDLAAAGIVPGKLAKPLAELGWALFEQGRLTLTAEAAEEPPACDIEAVLTAVHVAGGVLELDEKAEARLLAAAQRLRGRKELLQLRERARRRLRLTADGSRLALRVRSGEVLAQATANELTPEMLESGSWREVSFRAYDVSLAAERIYPGKAHPLARLIEEVRLAFLELGFNEAGCPMAEMAFWDFDALFQPQDHPAREMQDTFYCATPASYELPAADLVERVRRTHEDGGGTGSLGWRYQWSPQRAAQVVLRTHMTASSIEALARNPRAPQKVFSIGRVFRRETVDFKHLPEFMQVDGIIIDEQSSFTALLGTLQAFLARIGIPRMRFKPDFFPYTEPSAGVEAEVNGRWLELAGCGIFRPEVTAPFGCNAPVLAWGFGLERLAMARYGVSVIKDLYQADLDWLKAARLEA